MMQNQASYMVTYIKMLSLFCEVNFQNGLDQSSLFSIIDV